MGNARWRLETVLNRTSATLARLGLVSDVEIIVADWGSVEPLSDVLRLSPIARQCVKFLHVPPDIAVERQRDSVFPEVLALNAAFRRSSGAYVGRIDNDTIVGAAFFRRFFKLIQHPPAAIDPKRSFLFVQRRCVPFEFASRSPSPRAISWLLDGFSALLPVERINRPNHFFQSPVGIMLLHRDVWSECGGYNESLLYWGWMECDLAFRLMKKYPAVDLGEHIGRSLFHLEHYDPSTPRKVQRKINPMRRDAPFAPNDANWGLNDVAMILTTQTKDFEIAESHESFTSTIRSLLAGLSPLPKLNVKWLANDWPFSLIWFEPKTGHLRRRFRAPKPAIA